MTFNELLEATKGMDLEAMGVSLGKPDNRSDSLSCFQYGDEWVMREYEGRYSVFQKQGTEEDVIKKVFEKIKLRKNKCSLGDGDKKIINITLEMSEDDYKEMQNIMKDKSMTLSEYILDLIDEDLEGWRNWDDMVKRAEEAKKGPIYSMEEVLENIKQYDDETEYLLSNEANAKWLMKSMKQLDDKFNNEGE